MQQDTFMQHPMTLEDKVQQAFDRLDQIKAVATHPAAVAWTGGKDSTVALDIWKRYLQERKPDQRILAINLDTGHKFPEICRFRDMLAQDWDLDLHILRPGPDAEEVPLAADPLVCCNVRKILPLKKGLRELQIKLLLSGLRRDEHPDRAQRAWCEERNDPQHSFMHPVLEFTEMDIWAYITSRNLPYCELYTQGYRSLGCAPCTAAPGADLQPAASERSGRAQNKEGALSQLRSMGYF